MLQSYYRDLLSKGKSPYTVKMLNKAIKSSLSYAVRINYIGFNCSDGVIPPKIKINEENDFKFFSLEEQK